MTVRWGSDALAWRGSKSSKLTLPSPRLHSHANSASCTDLLEEEPVRAPDVKDAALLGMHGKAASSGERSAPFPFTLLSGELSESETAAVPADRDSAQETASWVIPWDDRSRRSVCNAHSALPRTRSCKWQAAFASSQKCVGTRQSAQLPAAARIRARRPHVRGPVQSGLRAPTPAKKFT